MIELNDSNFNSEIAKVGEVAVLDFWHDSCGPCRMLAPLIEDVSAKRNIPLVKVNVLENTEIPGLYGVRAVPTLILLKQGKETARRVGMASREQLEQWIEAGLNGVQNGEKEKAE